MVRSSANLLDRHPSWIAMLVGTAGVGLVGVVDFLTGAEISFAVFYLLPIAFAAWFGGRTIGLMVAFTACAAWLAADLMADAGSSHPLIPFWNGTVRLVLFALNALMLSEIHRRLDSEEHLARIDPLTRALNGLAFRERAEVELVRARRYGSVFTLVYIDLDNFKKLNDLHGHQTGDRALAEIAEVIRAEMRETDAVARLGGDELVVLMPETGSTEATVAVERIRLAVARLMERTGWPVTLSVGAVIFERSPADVAEAVHMADEVMYTVKRSGKNGFVLKTHPAACESAPVDPRETRPLRKFR
jgi:diguanylate cyclase (GGDEF)-like protein